LPEQLSLFDEASPEQRIVTYRFTRSKRRTIGLTVDASGLSVRAPHRAPWREIEAFLREKHHWIVARLSEWAAVPPPAVIRGANGEVLPLFGEQVALEVREGHGNVARSATRVVVSAPAGRRAGLVLRLLVEWLKRQALTALAPRAAHYAARLGLAPGRAIARAPPMGSLHRGRIHPAQLAAGASGADARRLRRGARSGASGRTQSFETLLESARLVVS
jgi:hypothetical protein